MACHKHGKVINLMETRKTKSWFEKNPKKTIIGFVFVSFLLIDLFMGAIFIRDEKWEFHSYFLKGLKTNFSQLIKWRDKEYYIYTDSFGFKCGKDRNRVLKNNRYRILFIGDSFTEGIGYPYRMTFPGIIDKELEKDDIDVFNAGVVSSSPKVYYLRTKYLLTKKAFHFNELFVFIDISDIQDEIGHEQFTPSDRTAFHRLIHRYLKRHSYLHNKFGTPLLAYLLRKKELYLYSRKKDDVVISDVKSRQNGQKKVDLKAFYKNRLKERYKWTLHEKPFKPWVQKGFRLAEENMKRLCLLCNDHGIRITIAVFPSPYQIRTRDINSLHVTFWKSFAESHNVRFINYFPDFINSGNSNDVIKKYFIPGDVHWNEHGHALIAKKVLNIIRKK